MNFEPTEEQAALADSVDRLLRDHHGFEQRRALVAQPAYSPALWRKLAELGVSALGIPQAWGGLGGGCVDRLPVVQAFGRSQLVEPYLTCVLSAAALREAGSDAQLRAWLPSIASGERVLAWAHDEAAARHDPAWVETRARQVDGQWQLQGRKLLVRHAGAASAFVVSARLDGEPGDAHGVALFLVDAAVRGLSLRPTRLIDDTLAADVLLDAAVGQPLGSVDDGARAHRALQAAWREGVATTCADMTGTMEAAFALTTAYVKVRRQFGRAIGSYQALRHRIAEMAVGVEMARSMAIAAAVAADAPEEPASQGDLLRAKLVVGRHARAVCHAAIQVHGGIAMTEEYPAGHCLRRIHVLDQLFGDTQAMAARLARLRASDPLYDCH